jgi:putative DNA primase/helicase
MNTNFSELKKKADIVAVISRYVALKKDGPHFRGCCPFHEEKTASFMVTPGKNIWHCFGGCDAGGDVIDFLVRYGKTMKEVIEILGGGEDKGGKRAEQIKAAVKTASAKVWKQAVPSEQPKTFYHYRYGQPVKMWPYVNKFGVPVSYDCRFETTEGKKVLPFTFCTDGKQGEWRWQAMDEPRLISALDKLLADPARPVLIVEGRKTAEAVQKILTIPLVISWQGGSNAAQLTDWSVISGRKVLIWQDNDYGGWKVAKQIGDILLPNNETVKYVHNPEGKEKGWDGADAVAEGWNKNDAKRYVNENMHDAPQYTELGKPQSNAEKNTNVVDSVGQVLAAGSTIASRVPGTEGMQQVGPNGNKIVGQIPPQEDEETELSRNAYFRFLGFVNNDGKLQHCFYNNTTKTIVKLSVSGMGKGANLLDLAPLNFWERYFPNKQTSFNLAMACNWLVCSSQQVGIFRGENIRGRGAWLDKEKVVIHTGDKIIVNGRVFDLGDYRSDYIYEQGGPLGYDIGNPLNKKEASLLLEFCRQLRWQRQVNAHLLAGFCVVAPFCGALSWRPHAWITGPAGCGKTWVLGQIVKPMLGGTAISVQGATSEAGLRQALRKDARPTVFDEAEGGDNKNDQDRMDRIMGLIRASSAEGGGDIIKGTSASGADAYQVRTCAIFASIGMQLNQQSDRTRVTILNMLAPEDGEKGQLEAKKHYEKLLAFQQGLPEGFAQRMQARTIRLLPVILKNIKTFSAAAAAVLGQQRMGDQLGAMLAGAYSLISDAEIDFAKALEWVKEKDWSEENALAETKDEHNLFQHIMEQQIPVEGAFTNHNRTIGECVRVVLGFDTDGKVTSSSCEISLKRNGIKVGQMNSRGYIYISNTADKIKRILYQTSWSRNHANILMRIPGAKKVEPTRFSSTMTRAVAIPIDYLTEGI